MAFPILRVGMVATSRYPVSGFVSYVNQGAKIGQGQRRESYRHHGSYGIDYCTRCSYLEG